MSDSPLPGLTTLREEPPSLTLRTARGIVWLAANTLGSKLLTTIGQVILARLLLPADWGVYALVGVIAGFAGVLQNTGMREILIQRSSHFRRWANSAFWMSLSIASISGLLMAAAGVLAAWAFGFADLGGAILVLALAAPIEALAVVPVARAQSNIRFRAVAMLNLSTTGLTVALSAGMAWLGFGVYSFAVPRLLVALVAAAFWWGITDVRVKPRPQLRRWKYLFGDARLLIGTAACFMIVMQADRVALGLWYPLGDAEKVLGWYSFASALSMQLMLLVTGNVAVVLMPALTKVQGEPQRQADAFLRAVDVLAAVVVPLYLLQATLAGPLLRVVCGPKWINAIGLYQILSLGLVSAAVSSLGGSVMQAKGKFLVYFRLSVASAGVFCAVIALGVYLDGVRGVAIADAVHQWIFSLVGLAIVARQIQARYFTVLFRCARPFVLAGVTVVAAALLIRLVPLAQWNPIDESHVAASLSGRAWRFLRANFQDIATIGAVSAITMLLYVPAVHFLMPGVWSSIPGYLMRRPQRQVAI